MSAAEWIAAGMLLAAMAAVVLIATWFINRDPMARSGPRPLWHSLLVGFGTAAVLFVLGFVLLDIGRAMFTAPLLGLLVGWWHRHQHHPKTLSTDADEARTEPGARGPRT